MRGDDPYSIYDRFDFEVITGKGEMGTVGDCWDRFMVRVLEMIESVKIIRQALQQMPEGPIMHEKIKKVIRVPAGRVYGRTEAPRGELGYYLISAGKGRGPNRLQAPSPRFSNPRVLEEISRGFMLADLIAVIGSLARVRGWVDRLCSMGVGLG